MRAIGLALSLFLLAAPRLAAAADRFFTTTDGVRLHYIEAGPSFAPTLVFVPGWTMPAWIFQPQIAFFSRDYHVVVLDPRGQGDSDAPPSGYEPFRRGADIRDLIAALGHRQVVLVGWSLGVLDDLSYVHQFGDSSLLALVLIDNSVGEDPAPVPRPHAAVPRRPRLARDEWMARFVRSMFRRDPGEAYLDRLTDAALRTPPDAAARLLSYPVPRSYWREGIDAARCPILYIVRPALAEQAANLQADHPRVVADVYGDAGHALFVDDAGRFNAQMLGFLRNVLRP